MLLKLARASLWSRRGTAGLCVLSIAISVFVLLGVEFIRQEARESFGRTLAGTDLIVGARGGQLNLLLYSVFRIGEPTNNIRWDSYRAIAADPAVAWTVPLSLGDSHRGFRVLGTTPAYVEHYRYGADRALAVDAGAFEFAGRGAVVGANVAAKLGYTTGAKIVLAHGTGGVSFQQHGDHPFTVTGILARTGTPVDDTVHVSLDAIDEIHEGFNARSARRGESQRTITAFLVGLKSRMLAFRLQRQINEYAAEPLQAILPGVALAQLWRMLGSVENVLRVISGLVLLSAFLGMSTMFLASLRERRGEIAVLRTIGASPLFLFLMLELEALLLAVLGFAGGVLLVGGSTVVAQNWLREDFGLLITAYVPDATTALLLALILGLAGLCALAPAVGAYRSALGKSLVRR
jgi:putative ABC transport system permease protein